MKPIFYAYLITVLVLSGCSSGKSTFERGNYYEAVLTSVNRLRKNSDHKKSIETLRQAYPMAVAFYEDRARTSLSSAERFKWTEVVKSYTFINNMYDEIKRCPGALAVVPNPVNYFTKLQEARQNAAEEHYAAGILALQGKTRQDAKLAYGYFKTANDYVQGYKEVNDYLEAALSAATVKILVEPIPVHSKSVGVSAEFFNDKISEFVHSAPINEFVKFYTRAEAQKLKLNPDHIIQLQFDDFAVGEVHKYEKEIQLSKDSVVMGTYVSPSTTGTQPANNNSVAATNRNGLVVSGAGVLASSAPKVNNPQSSGSAGVPANTTSAEDERQKALAEKQKADALAAERDRAEAERQKVAKEAAEKALADKAAAERAQAEKERLQREQLEKERIEKERAEKERLEAERLEKERLEKERADKERADKLKTEKEQAERAQAERERVEKEAADIEKVERERAAKEAEKAKADKERADKEMEEKQKAEKEKADKEKAEKEKIERQNTEKEKVEKSKYVDPTINSEDTLNIVDGVTVCHMPPGNKMNARTLRINRAALKAHLAHGDVEGTCEGEKKEDHAKPAKEQKQKAASGGNEKPDSKGKGPGGSASMQKLPEASSPLLQREQLLIASATDNPADILLYSDISILADTNKVYGTVKATLYHHTKTTTSKGIVSFRIIDAKTGALLSSEKMPGEFVWKSEWATFNGDERALSAEQLRLTKQKELRPPAAQDLFIEFTRPIYDQITTRIKEFYKNY